VDSRFHDAFSRYLESATTGVIETPPSERPLSAPSLVRLIDEAAAAELPQRGLRLRDDARYLLFVNLQEMVIRPRADVVPSERGTLLDAVRGDVRKILQTASLDPGDGPPDDQRDIGALSAYDVLAATVAVSGELQVAGRRGWIGVR
jgi:hypothetical protein